MTPEKKSIFPPNKNILVRLRSRLLSPGLEPVLSHTEKSCIVLDFKNHNLNINFVCTKLRYIIFQYVSEPVLI